MTFCGIFSPLNERKQAFEVANNHVFQIFSNYPRPGGLIDSKCTHFIDPLNENDLSFFLASFVLGTEADFYPFNEDDLRNDLRFELGSFLLGTEDDFKYYLPYLLQSVYIDQNEKSSEYYIDKNEESSEFIDKISRISFLPEEAEAITHWFIAYVQFIYIQRFEINVQNLRADAQKWLNEDTNNNFYLSQPFCEFSEEYKKIRWFLPARTQEDFSNLLDLWPQTDLDLIAFSLILTTKFLSVVTDVDEIFPINKIRLWFLNIEKHLEEYFWKTSNPRLQQLLSDALQIMINMKKCL